jgi:hypothetical protein
MTGIVLDSLEVTARFDAICAQVGAQARGITLAQLAAAACARPRARSTRARLRQDRRPRVRPRSRRGRAREPMSATKRWDAIPYQRHAKASTPSDSPAAQPQSMQAPCIVMQHAAREQPGTHRGDTFAEPVSAWGTTSYAFFPDWEFRGTLLLRDILIRKLWKLCTEYAYRTNWPETLVGSGGMRI